MITLPHKELLHTLTLAKSGVSKSVFTDQGDCFIFRDGKVFTHSGDIALTITLPDVPGIREFTAAINADRLLAHLKSWPDDAVTITQKGDTGITLKSKTTRVGLSMIKDITAPIGSEGNPDDSSLIALDPKAFTTALKAAISAVDKDNARNLDSVHIGACDDGTYVEGTDGRQLCRHYFDKARLFDHKGYVIPANSAKELAGFAPHQMGTNSTWAHFDCLGAKFATRLLIIQYPNVEGVITGAKNAPDKIAFEEEGDAALLRAAIAAPMHGDAKYVVVTTSHEKDEAHFKSRGGQDWVRDTVKAKSNKDILFAMSVPMLRGLLSHSNKLLVDSHAIFTSTDDCIRVGSVIRLPEEDIAKYEERASS